MIIEIRNRSSFLVIVLILLRSFFISQIDLLFSIELFAIFLFSQLPCLLRLEQWCVQSSSIQADNICFFLCLLFLHCQYFLNYFPLVNQFNGYDIVLIYFLIRFYQMVQHFSDFLWHKGYWPGKQVQKVR